MFSTIVDPPRTCIENVWVDIVQIERTGVCNFEFAVKLEVCMIVRLTRLMQLMTDDVLRRPKPLGERRKYGLLVWDRVGYTHRTRIRQPDVLALHKESTADLSSIRTHLCLAGRSRHSRLLK